MRAVTTHQTGQEVIRDVQDGVAVILTSLFDDRGTSPLRSVRSVDQRVAEDRGGGVKDTMSTNPRQRLGKRSWRSSWPRWGDLRSKRDRVASAGAAMSKVNISGRRQCTSCGPGRTCAPSCHRGEAAHRVLDEGLERHRASRSMVRVGWQRGRRGVDAPDSIVVPLAMNVKVPGGKGRVVGWEPGLGRSELEDTFTISVSVTATGRRRLRE